jgi:hypothetical protein
MEAKLRMNADTATFLLRNRHDVRGIHFRFLPMDLNCRASIFLEGKRGMSTHILPSRAEYFYGRSIYFITALDGLGTLIKHAEIEHQVDCAGVWVPLWTARALASA